jgi:hypothetical protein
MSRMGKMVSSPITLSRMKPVHGAKTKIQVFRKLKRGLFGKTHHQSLDFLAQCIRKDMKKRRKPVGFSTFSIQKKVRVN